MIYHKCQKLVMLLVYINYLIYSVSLVSVYVYSYKLYGIKMSKIVNFENILREDLTNYSGASNLKFNEKIKSLIASGKEIYHFGFGQSPFPVPAPFVKQLQVTLQIKHLHLLI